MSHRNRNVLIAVMAVLVVVVGALIVTHKSTPSITERNAAFLQEVQTQQAQWCADKPIGGDCVVPPADSVLLSMGQRACAVLIATQPSSSAPAMVDLLGGPLVGGENEVFVAMSSPQPQKTSVRVVTAAPVISH